MHIYKLTGGTSLEEKATLESNRGAITSLAYSPNGALLAAADSQRNVLVYDTATNSLKIHQWVFHTARVNCVAWAPNSLHAVSGGLDTNVEVWSVERPMKHVTIRNAHLDSVNGVAFLDDSTIASAGGDATIKVWSVTLP